MNLARLVSLVKSKHPKIYRRLEILAAELKISVPEAILYCLEGETTRCKEDKQLRCFFAVRGVTTQKRSTLNPQGEK